MRSCCNSQDGPRAMKVPPRCRALSREIHARGWRSCLRCRASHHPEAPTSSVMRVAGERVRSTSGVETRHRERGGRRRRGWRGTRRRRGGRRGRWRGRRRRARRRRARRRERRRGRRLRRRARSRARARHRELRDDADRHPRARRQHDEDARATGAKRARAERREMSRGLFGFHAEETLAVTMPKYELGHCPVGRSSIAHRAVSGAGSGTPSCVRRSSRRPPLPTASSRILWSENPPKMATASRP